MRDSRDEPGARHFTAFVKPLDLAAIAVPPGTRPPAAVHVSLSWPPRSRTAALLTLRPRSPAKPSPTRRNGGESRSRSSAPTARQAAQPQLTDVLATFVNRDHKTPSAATVVLRTPAGDAEAGALLRDPEPRRCDRGWVGRLRPRVRPASSPRCPRPLTIGSVELGDGAGLRLPLRAVRRRRRTLDHRICGGGGAYPLCGQVLATPRARFLRSGSRASPNGPQIVVSTYPPRAAPCRSADVGPAVLLQIGGDGWPSAKPGRSSTTAVTAPERSFGLPTANGPLRPAVARQRLLDLFGKIFSPPEVVDTDRVRTRQARRPPSPRSMSAGTASRTPLITERPADVFRSSSLVLRPSVISARFREQADPPSPGFAHNGACRTAITTLPDPCRTSRCRPCRCPPAGPLPSVSDGPNPSANRRGSQAARGRAARG